MKARRIIGASMFFWSVGTRLPAGKARQIDIQIKRKTSRN